VINNLKVNNFFPPFAALILWGFWAFLPKMAMKDNSMQPHSVIFFEALGGTFVTIPMMLSLQGKLKRDKRGVSIIACGSSLSIIAILCYYTALRLGPVATVSTITAMYPIVGIALARIFLKEKMNRLQFLAAAMAMASIYLLAG
jgi:drug/metabolite transporter (DMT)-like permease